MKVSAFFVSAIAFLILALMTPIVIHAQTDDDLSATVRAAILSDPRTAELSEAEIESMVTSLAEGAAVQGITSEDITWRPQEEVAKSGAVCGNLPVFFCALNQAFGFDGSDLVIPIGLVVSSALLLFLIGSILLHQHGHHPIAGRISTPSLH
ncbi:MAG: hypothetical protein AAB798_00530 [Patescibacteria group bacterium]